jgi:hypothetical protein
VDTGCVQGVNAWGMGHAQGYSVGHAQGYSVQGMHKGIVYMDMDMDMDMAMDMGHGSWGRCMPV